MSNESSVPLTIESINGLLARIEALEKQPTAWTRGDIKLWYRSVSDLPTGWWPCDGTVAPDGVTTPDLRGRVPVGLKSTDADFDTLGETGGAKTANLQHTHTIDHDHPSVDSGPPSNTASVAPGVGNAAAGDATHPVNIPSFAAAGAPIPNSGNGLSATQPVMSPYAVVTFAYRYL